MKSRTKLIDKVYAELKAMILTFNLKPGQKIYELEIAQTLGVSRTPIREALSTLLQEGLVKKAPGKGYFVSNITAKEIEELYEIREVLEILAVHSAIKKATPGDWEMLDREIESAMPVDDPENPTIKLFTDSHRFHQTFAKISGNESLLQFLDLIADKIARTHCINALFLDRALNSHDEHIEILQLIKSGETEKGIAALREHIRTSKEGLLHSLEKTKNLLY